jgi:hypothetical protein
MIDTLISSKTRIKLLLKFFLNSNNTSYLRNLESEFGESTNGIRIELNRLEKAGMLTSFAKGNKKLFKANTKHPLFSEINSILRKYVGLDSIVENVVVRLGEVRKVYLAGNFCRGLDSDIIDLVFVGRIDKSYLIQLIDKAEGLIKRKIRYIIFNTDQEFRAASNNFLTQPWLIWSDEN